MARASLTFERSWPIGLFSKRPARRLALGMVGLDEVDEGGRLVGEPGDVEQIGADRFCRSLVVASTTNTTSLLLNTLPAGSAVEL